MSAYQQKDNSGALFTNNRRERDSQPNYTGDAVIDGVKYRISAWEKTSKNGSTYYSLSFTKDGAPRQERRNERPTAEKRGSLKDQLSDDVPW